MPDVDIVQVWELLKSMDAKIDKILERLHITTEDENMQTRDMTETLRIRELLHLIPLNEWPEWGREYGHR